MISKLARDNVNIYSPGGSISLKSSSGYIDEDGRLIGSPFTNAQKLKHLPMHEFTYMGYGSSQGQVVDPVIEASNIKKIREIIQHKKISEKEDKPVTIGNRVIIKSNSLAAVIRA